MLDLEDDAARANLGVGYRIPTEEDWQELLDNCKWEAVTITLPEITGSVADEIHCTMESDRT